MELFIELMKLATALLGFASAVMALVSKTQGDDQRQKESRE